jgi:hypothetical protein
VLGADDGAGAALAVAVRGETGALVLSLGSFSRMRSNPFFDVVRAKIAETVASDELGR